MGEFLLPMSLLGQVGGDDTNSLKLAFAYRTQRKTNGQELLFILPHMPDALHLLGTFLNFLQQRIQAGIVIGLYDLAQGRANQLFQGDVQHAGKMLVGKKN